MRRGLVFPVLAVLWGGWSGAQLVLPDFPTNIEIHREFGGEHPAPYKHPASIAELANGDLYISYFGGANEYDNGTAVYGSRLKPGETQWSPPAVIADTPFEGEGNPVVWQAPDGLVWLFYNNRKGDTWSNSRVKVKISKDGAETWSDSFMLTYEEGTMVRGQPIVLMNGDYLLPLYLEKGSDREKTGAETSSYFMIYTPSTGVWRETNHIHSPQGNLQAQPVQISEKEVICYLRRGGDYGPTTDGWTLRAESHDGGNTWSDAVPTEFPNPNAAVECIKLKNGHLLLVYNDNMSDRTPLAAAVSTDGGKTWPHKRVLAGGDNDYAYPYAIQSRDGKIHLIYTTNGRTTIMRAVFEEDAITRFNKE